MIIRPEELFQGKDLPSHFKTIKVDVRRWNALKNLKKENETFNDVIGELLLQRTKSIGDENVKGILYKRKTSFFSFGETNPIGLEYEYNDVKGEKYDFVLDVKIKKIFYGKKSLNPSEFFGVDNSHKHYSSGFLLLYLMAVRRVLMKEFRMAFHLFEMQVSLDNITFWRKLYYDYSLSEESFKHDIEEPLRLSVEEKIPDNYRKKVRQSIMESKNFLEGYK